MIGSAIGIAKTLIARLVPDRNARKEAEEELEKMEQSGELSLLMAQVEVNKQEAAHKSLFVAGWRPAIGWICGAAMANNYLIVPYVAAFSGAAVSLNLSEMFPVLLGMLGLGGLRTYEKAKGVSRER